MAQKARAAMTPAPVALPADTPLAEAARRMRDVAIERDEESALADISAAPPNV